MTYLNRASIDPSTPFCAEAFYTGLRAGGGDPVVRNGALHFLVGEFPVSNLNKWAALHDPTGSLRVGYARDAWAKRASDDEIILLGTRQ